MKLVHLVGFIIKEICYDARSHVRKICTTPLCICDMFWLAFVLRIRQVKSKLFQQYHLLERDAKPIVLNFPAL